MALQARGHPEPPPRRPKERLPQQPSAHAGRRRAPHPAALSCGLKHAGGLQPLQWGLWPRRPSSRGPSPACLRRRSPHDGRQGAPHEASLRGPSTWSWLRGAAAPRWHDGGQGTPNEARIRRRWSPSVRPSALRGPRGASSASHVPPAGTRGPRAPYDGRGVPAARRPWGPCPPPTNGRDGQQSVRSPATEARRQGWRAWRQGIRGRLLDGAAPMKKPPSALSIPLRNPSLNNSTKLCCPHACTRTSVMRPSPQTP